MTVVLFSLDGRKICLAIVRLILLQVFDFEKELKNGKMCSNINSKTTKRAKTKSIRHWKVESV